MNIDRKNSSDYLNIMSNKNLHKLVGPIRIKILELIDKKSKEGISLEKIGEHCDLSKVQISTLRSKKRGANLSLNTALKVWTGLGHPPETLIADCTVDPDLAAKIIHIQKTSYSKELELFVEVFYNNKFANPSELAKVEAYLEMIHDRILAKKNQSQNNSDRKSVNCLK